MTAADDDRGQIVLVGAVALAFIIVTLVLVLGSVMYSENVGSEQSIRAAEEAGAFSHEARRASASILLRVNQANLTTQSALGDAAADNLTTYTRLEREHRVENTGTFVTVEYDHPNSTVGTRIVHDDPAVAFEDATGDPSWTVVPSGANADIDAFTATFDVSAMPVGAPFVVTVTGNDGGFTRYRQIFLVNDGNELDIYLGSSIGGPPTIAGSPLLCSVSQSEVTVEFSNGTVRNASSCPSFDFTHDMTAPHELTFAGGDNAYGTYELVVNTTDASIENDLNPYTAAEPNSPYYTYVVWKASVVTTYSSPTVDYENRQEIAIYNESR